MYGFWRTKDGYLDNERRTVVNKLALTAVFPLAVLAFVALFVSGLGELLLQQTKILSPAVALAFATLVLALASYMSMREPQTQRPPSPLLRFLEQGMRRLGMMSPTAARVYDAIVSGFVATMAMSMVLLLAYLIGGNLGSLDHNASFVANWLWYLTHNRVAATANDTLVAAIAINMIMGLIWACVYVFYFDGGLRARGVESRWRSGMLFSLLPWALSLVVFLPLAGGGFLGFGIGAGPLPIIGNLLLHLVYGATLGGFHALGDITQQNPVHLFDHEANRDDGERGAALGIVVGTTLGLVIGALHGAVVIDGTVLASSVLVMLCLGGFLGAAGALVGSMIALNLSDMLAEDTTPQAPGPVMGAGVAGAPVV